MKAIDGIDLSQLTTDTQAAYLESQRTRLKERITKLLEKRRTSEESIAALKAQISKYEQKITDVASKLTELAAGNWGVLQDDPLPRVTVDGQIDGARCQEGE